MSKRSSARLLSGLDVMYRQEIEEIRHELERVKGPTEKLNIIFTESRIAGEWVTSQMLTIVSGLRQMQVYIGLAELRSDDLIVGAEITKVEYFEALRARTDPVAKLLIGIGATILEAPEDEVSLAALILPDRETTLSTGERALKQANGYYWRSRNTDSHDTVPALPFDETALV